MNCSGTVSICQGSEADGASLGCVWGGGHAVLRAELGGLNAAPGRAPWL